MNRGFAFAEIYFCFFCFAIYRGFAFDRTTITGSTGIYDEELDELDLLSTLSDE